MSVVEELSLQSSGLDHEGSSHEAGAAKVSESESDGKRDSWMSESVEVSLGDWQLQPAETEEVTSLGDGL